MALTRDFRETVQARAKGDPAFRKWLLGEAVEALLAGEVALGKELLRDCINATIGFPKLAQRTKIHVKTLHQMFGPGELLRHRTDDMPTYRYQSVYFREARFRITSGLPTIQE